MWNLEVKHKDVKPGDVVHSFRYPDDHKWFEMPVGTVVAGVDSRGFINTTRSKSMWDPDYGRIFRVQRATDFQILEVLTKDLKVGDIATDIGRPQPDKSYQWGGVELDSKRWTITRVDDVQAYFGNMASYESFKSTVMWKVKRPTALAPAASGRYPHKCPKCNGAVYIGFTDVEHEKPCLSS